MCGCINKIVIDQDWHVTYALNLFIHSIIQLSVKIEIDEGDNLNPARDVNACPEFGALKCFVRSLIRIIPFAYMRSETVRAVAKPNEILAELGHDTQIVVASPAPADGTGVRSSVGDNSEEYNDE